MADLPPSVVDREVRFRVKIYKITEVDLLKHSFTADFFLEASWTDDELQPRTTQTTCSADRWERQFPYSRGVDASLHWTPRLQFTNNVKLWDREDWYSVFAEDAVGHPLPKTDGVVVCFKMRAVGIFQNQFHIRDYPFDAQDLAIVFNSCFHIDPGSASPLPPRSLANCRADSRAGSTFAAPGDSGGAAGRRRAYNVTLVKNTNPQPVMILFSIGRSAFHSYGVDFHSRVLLCTAMTGLPPRRRSRSRAGSAR